MENAYCGKKCLSCRHRTELNCPGCTKGPGRGFRGKYECPVAKCCYDSNLASCLECTKQVNCQKKDQAEALLQQRVRKQQRLKSEMIQKDRPLALRLVILCVLGVFFRIFNWVTGGEVIDNRTLLVMLFALQVFAGLTMLSVGFINSHFFIAGASFLVAPVIDFVVSLLTSKPFFSVEIFLIESISTFVFIYQISLGCAEVMDHYDNNLADKWRGYWILYCLALLLTIIFVLFSQTDYRFLSTASAVLTLILAVAVFILDVIRFVMYISSASKLWNQ